MKQKKIKTGWLVFVFILFTAPALHSQQHFGITAGFGFPEAFHLSLRYHWNQTHVGVYYGFATDWQSAGTSLAYHVLGRSKHTSIKPVYLKAGLFFNRWEDFLIWDQFKYNSLELRGGYTFNFSKKVGFELDAGPALALFRKQDYIKSNEVAMSVGFGGRFFLRL